MLRRATYWISGNSVGVAQQRHRGGAIFFTSARVVSGEP